MLPSTLAQHVFGIGVANGSLYASPSPAAAAAASPEPSPGPESRSRLSIAQLTEQQATRPGVTITYISSHRSESREGDFGHTARQMRRIGKSTGTPAWKELPPGQMEQPPGTPAWERGAWNGASWVPEKDENIPDSVWETHDESDIGSRCGFSWDDAAAKANLNMCKTDGDCRNVNPGGARWRDSFDENGQWLGDPEYGCWQDLPDYQRSPQGDCVSKNPHRMSDLHCQLTCGATNGYGICSENCACAITSTAWDAGSPIQQPDEEVHNRDMPQKSPELVESVSKEYDQIPSGLPACGWQAGAGCTEVTQYECFDGHANRLAWKQDQVPACSHENWFGNEGCERSCVHVNQLKPAPYYAIWIPGPQARDPLPGERMPLYKHNPDRMTPALRGISMQNLDVSMSRICKSNDHKFLAFTMYSPHYEEKALRLVRSCDRAGVCCKAVLLPPTAFGPDLAEDSLKFRFESISMKPAFIREQMRLTDLPIVYMECASAA